MNILSFIAFAGIGAGEFTVCAQLKVLTTAGFSVLVLGTTLSAVKWRALALLVLGCILVASPSLKSRDDSNEKEMSLVILGYAAVLSEVVLRYIYCPNFFVST
jgi:UDP-sugar transporter A1/2/3